MCLQALSALHAGNAGEADAGLATPLEVYQGLAADGYQVSYRRVPLSRERTPEAADLDVLHQQLMTQPVGRIPLPLTISAFMHIVSLCIDIVSNRRDHDYASLMLSLCIQGVGATCYMVFHMYVCVPGTPCNMLHPAQPLHVLC